MTQLDLINRELVKHSELFNEYKIKRLGIFGSYARGDNTPDSDIDFIIEFSEIIDLFQYVHLNESFKEIFSRDVDLVYISDIKPHLREKILSEVKWLERE